MNGRMKRVARRMADAKADALVVTRPGGLLYLTGFTGSTGLLLLTDKGAWLAVDSRYWKQAEMEVDGTRVIRAKGSLMEAVARVAPLRGRGRRVAFEAEHVTVSERQRVAKTLRGHHLVATKGLIAKAAAVKEPWEVACIRKASRIAERSLRETIPLVKPGVMELDVALELEAKMRRYGADEIGFPTIVASGPRSAMPHGVASRRKIGHDEFVTVDFGCRYRGYCCDITRTFAVGKANRKMREVYDLVLRAQKAAVSAVAPGRKAAAVDAVARDMIAAAGYGENFGHGLGHALGVDVHEWPTLGPKSKATLEPGNVITIEPGVYIERFGGVRIEDDVLVTKTGREVLTRLPKELVLL